LNFNIFESSKNWYLDLVSPTALPVHEVKASLFRVLGHPARVRILELLRDGERSVGQLQAELGLDSGGTSQHLSALRRVGVVESRRDGTSVLYRVDDGRVFDLLAAGKDIIMRRLAADQTLLRELDSS
jgi:ArsR family transcriptional regulator